MPSFGLNLQAEYNRCVLPRLTAKLGERDIEKWRKEDKLELDREATIEEKIRIRKKARARDRAEASRRRDKGQPAMKKRRIEDQEVQCKSQEQKRKAEAKRLEKEKKAEVDSYAILSVLMPTVFVGTIIVVLSLCAGLHIHKGNRELHREQRREYIRRSREAAGRPSAAVAAAARRGARSSRDAKTAPSRGGEGGGGWR